MPQVDFYILDSNLPASRREFVARLLGKLQHLGKSAWIVVDDGEEAQQLDRLLWEFPPESFLPHAIHAAAEDQADVPVLILPEATAAQTDALPQVYINLCSTPPAQHGKLQRQVEVVLKEDSDALAASRRHYRHYRDLGYEVKSHNIRTRVQSHVGP